MSLDEHLDVSWLHALSGAIDAGVLLVSARAGVEQASAPALDLLGQGSLAELRARWPEILRQVERARALAAGARAAANGAGSVVDLELALDERATRALRWRSIRAEDGVGDREVVLLRDLAQARACDDELRLAARHDVFARLYPASAHDLRGPLNAVGLNLEVLKGSLAEGDLDGDAADCLRAIGVELDRFKRAFDLFLRQTRPPEDLRRAFDLADLVREVAEMLGPLARRRKIEIAVEGASAPLVVEGRRDRLQHALLAVALAAVEALPEGGRLALALESAPRAARITIAGAARSASEPGRGTREPTLPSRGDAGLDVARVIVEQHGGTIVVERTGPESRCAIAVPTPTQTD